MLKAEEAIQLLTGHSSLLFVINPLSVEPAMGRQVARRVQI